MANCGIMLENMFLEYPEFRLPHSDWQDVNWAAPREFERTVALLGMPRFHAIEEMAQRTTIMDHSMRVLSGSLIFSEMALELGIGVNQSLLIFYADHHDDTEIITGDIPTPVKAKATSQEKAVMEEEELAAAAEIDDLIGKPTFISSFEEAIREYREQGSVTARLVNFVDKFDGLHEAINEVVTGTNKDGFRQVVKDYEPIFIKLRERNKDWHDTVEGFLGIGFFNFPNAELLSPKSIEDLDFSSADNFIESLSTGNPDSYKIWLMFNKFAFGLDFLKRTFPAWIDFFPQNVLDDINRVKNGTGRKVSNLILPPSYVLKPTFGETLALDDTLDRISDMAVEIRHRTGRIQAPEEFFFSPA